MEVILLEDVLNLGYKDDVVSVKKGYARNFLIPQKKAVIASESAKKVLAENQKQRAHKIAQIKADAQAIADKMEVFRNHQAKQVPQEPFLDRNKYTDCRCSCRKRI